MNEGKRAEILIVDDLPEKHLTYRVALEALDQNIVAVDSGEAALQLLLEREFAVILLDVNMPGMSGLETAALIRQRRKSRHTPIIFVTAFADDVQTVEGYTLGAVDYIQTPIVPEILRAKVGVFVELYRIRAELGRSHALLEQRVADRTAELERTAEQLRAEVHERKQAEERLTILVQELAHRVKNLLSVFQSITARTLTGGRSISDAREVLMGRLQSLGHAHELLTEASWHGAELREVVMAEIAGFSERVPDVRSRSRTKPFRCADIRTHRARALYQCRKIWRAFECERRGGRELDARRQWHHQLHELLLEGVWRSTSETCVS